MPVRYSSGIEEHLEVRKNVGVFDVSHMGEFIVEGPEAKKLVQWVTSNDVSKLGPGKVQYSCLPNNSGGIVPLSPLSYSQRCCTTYCTSSFVCTSCEILS